jgi:hypothetical protein
MGRELVIFELGPNNTRIFDVAASGGWDRVCMVVFQECLAAGAYGKAPPKTPRKPKPLAQADLGDLDKIEAYAKKQRKYEKQFHTRERKMEEWKVINAALAGDLFMARRVVEMLGPHHTTEELVDIPQSTPRWTFPIHVQADVLGKLLIQVMSNPFDKNNAGRLTKAPDAIELYRGTTTEPPQPGYFDVPPGDHGMTVIRLMGALNLLLKKGLHNLAAQDQARRVLEMAHIDYDVVKLAQQRMARFGDIPAVALARFVDAEDRQPESHQDRVRVDGFAKDTRFWLNQVKKAS